MHLANEHYIKKYHTVIIVIQLVLQYTTFIITISIGKTNVCNLFDVNRQFNDIRVAKDDIKITIY